MAKKNVIATIITMVMLLAGGTFGADWTGAVNDNWDEAGNWSTNAVPTINDAANFYNGTAIMYSGDHEAKDFFITQLGTSTGDISVTFKSGSSLSISPHHFYLGYYTGPYSSIANIESGAIINVAGSIVVGVYGSKARLNLAGEMNAGAFSINGVNTIVNFASTGMLIVTGDSTAVFADTSSWIQEGLLRIEGKTINDAGWPGFNAQYDAENNITTITAGAGSPGPSAASWTGAVSDDWNVAGNWDVDEVPGWNTSVTIGTGTCVIYSGNVTVKDFTAFANYSGSGNVSITVKNGASLSSSWNIDLGYFGGTETVYFTVEQGASATAGWMFNTRRPGITYTTIGGTLNALGSTSDYGIDISATTIIDFAATGKLISKGNMVETFNVWALPENNQFRDRGIGADDPQWGSTYGVVAAYDYTSNTTRLTSVAGPICDSTYRLPGDENMDCTVDFEDFALMAQNWMICAWDPQEACQ